MVDEFDDVGGHPQQADNPNNKRAAMIFFMA